MSKQLIYERCSLSVDWRSENLFAFRCILISFAFTTSSDVANIHSRTSRVVIQSKIVNKLEYKSRKLLYASRNVTYVHFSKCSFIFCVVRQTSIRQKKLQHFFVRVRRIILLRNVDTESYTRSTSILTIFSLVRSTMGYWDCYAVCDNRNWSLEVCA